MNVCHDGGLIVTFRTQWGAVEDAPASNAPLDEHSREYCRAREAAERAAAKRACSVHAQRIHQELAQSYARLVKGHDSKC